MKAARISRKVSRKSANVAVFLKFFGKTREICLETEKILKFDPISLRKLEIPKKNAVFSEFPQKIAEKSPEIAEFQLKTANFVAVSAKLSSSCEKTRKTPTKKFEFPNKIFDFKEIQSPNAVFKAYEQIFNEDDFSEGDSAKSRSSDDEIEEKFPDLQKKSQKNTAFVEKIEKTA